MGTLIGVDIGQEHERSAICVVETEDRETQGRSSEHFLVRLLERLPPGTKNVQLGQRLKVILGGISGLGKPRPTIHLNATGFGWPVVKLIKEQIDYMGTVTPVFFNHGDRATEEGRGSLSVLNVGKAFLVSNLKCLLETAQIHLPRTPDAEIPSQELLDYNISIPEDANERQGAFKVGSRDDLVNALGLAVHSQPGPWSGLAA